MMPWVVGFDCGGSSTRAVVVACDGSVLGQGLSGASNALAVGIDAAVRAVGAAFGQAYMEAGRPAMPCDAAVVARAGAGTSIDPALVRAIRAAVPARRLLVDGDTLAAWAGAFPGGAGLVVIAGTGSVAFGIAPNGERVQVGGWGYVLGDEGSGYAVGLAAIRSVLRFFDGRDDPTSLAMALIDHLHVRSPAGLVRRVYVEGITRDEIAALVPLVAAHAMVGDAVAMRIIEEAAEALALLARAGVERLGGGVAVAPLGGLFANVPLLAGSFVTHLGRVAPDVRVVAPHFDAVGGAAILALREAGVVVDDAVLSRVSQTLSGR